VRPCEPFVAAVLPRKERGRVIPRLPPGKTQRIGFDGKRRKRGVNELSRPRGSERYEAAFDAGKQSACPTLSVRRSRRSRRFCGQ